MGIVWNCTKEIVNTKIAGAWFKFQPDARKSMDDSKCQFINEFRDETGLVILPSEFDPMHDQYVEGFDKTEQGKATLEALREQGITKMLEFYRRIIKNNQLSLKRDLAHQYPEGDSARLAAIEMSEGEKQALAIVGRYQKEKKDVNAAKLKEIQKLLEDVGPIGD